MGGRITFPKIITLLCVFVTVVRFATDIFVPALPSIQSSLGISAAQAQLTLTVFFASFTVSQLFYGPLSDKIGRRKVILFGLLIYQVGALLSGLTHSFDALLLGRFVCGIGVGCGPVLIRSIAKDVLQDESLVKAFAYTSFAVACSLLVAPIIGAYIQTWFDWHDVFLFTFFQASAVLILLYFLLPETNLHHDSDATRIKVMYRNYKLLFKDPLFVSSMMPTALALGGFTAYFQVSPFIFETQMHYTAVQYSWLVLFIIAAFAITGVSLPYLNKRFGVSRVMSYGAGIMMIASISMLLLNINHIVNVYAILLPVTFFVVGIRFVGPNGTAKAMTLFPKIVGVAAAASGVITMAGIFAVSLVIVSFNLHSVWAFSTVYIVLSLLTIFFLYLQHRYAR